MQMLKNRISDLQNDTVKVMQCLSKILMSQSRSDNAIEKQMDDYLCELENLCVKSRTVLEKYRPFSISQSISPVNEHVNNIAGNIEVTDDGWLHITLNTLLPNCRRRVSSYISDTISRLIQYYGHELPYFEKAFMAIVEYCNYENHNALDNDNKGWKMIPNALKGRVIEDDNQFVLSMGLFTKISEDIRCEIYVLPFDEAANFMEFLENEDNCC